MFGKYKRKFVNQNAQREYVLSRHLKTTVLLIKFKLTSAFRIYSVDNKNFDLALNAAYLSPAEALVETEDVTPFHERLRNIDHCQHHV